MINNSEQFYRTIATSYEAIFPLKNPAITFTKEHLFEGAKVLDVGCATGEFSIALSEFCQQVEAFDLSEMMIELALKKTAKNVHFQVGDMLKIAETYTVEQFEVITCFGNTLVHLLSEENILAFLCQAKSLLKNKGKLLLQILNYDTILDKEIKTLPLIETDTLRFDRSYIFHENSRLLDFHTKLHLKKEDIVIENMANLYAIRPQELVNLLEKAGFSTIKLYSSFAKEVLSNEKLPLVICAE
ncbi:MAG: class I SAM-dependent methyltransferase [Flavobacteriaceae bacterium]|nr:class I SAM-dependent methyltransferase [Flavobacteriaceae bacterium]